MSLALELNQGRNSVPLKQLVEDSQRKDQRLHRIQTVVAKKVFLSHVRLDETVRDQLCLDDDLVEKEPDHDSKGESVALCRALKLCMSDSDR